MVTGVGRRYLTFVAVFPFFFCLFVCWSCDCRVLNYTEMYDMLHGYPISPDKVELP